MGFSHPCGITFRKTISSHDPIVTSSVHRRSISSSPAISAIHWVFENGAEAEIARYHLNGQDTELLIANFPTPQLAQQQLATLQKKYQRERRESGRRFATAIRQAGTITLLAIVAGAPSQSGCGKFVEHSSFRDGAHVERADFPVQGASN